MLFLYFASENRDFTGSMWRVDFPAGVAEAEFTIPIVQDTSSEEPEHFYLDLVIETPVDERVSAVDPSSQTVIIIITGVLVYTVHDNYYDTVYVLSLLFPSMRQVHQLFQSLFNVKFCLV